MIPQTSFRKRVSANIRNHPDHFLTTFVDQHDIADLLRQVRTSLPESLFDRGTSLESGSQY